MRALPSLVAALAVAATPALAGSVTLRASPEDSDGRVTLGDVFDGAGAASDVVVGQRAGPSVVLDAGQLQTLARQSGLTWANETGLRRVVVRRAMAPSGPPSANPSRPQQPPSGVAARAGSTVEVLTYAHSLMTGDIVQAKDVVFTAVQAHLAPSGAPMVAERVIGLSARRALRAGAPVSSRDLASPQVIARNDMVEVAFVSGGVRLTITGRATRDAALGDPVVITNLQSGRPISAVASGPGQAMVGPAVPSPSQFAAR